MAQSQHTTETLQNHVQKMAGATAATSLTAVELTSAAEMTTPVLRILVVCPKRIVGFLYALPALHALRQSYPGARICAVVSGQLREIAQQSPDIDDVWTWAPQNIAAQAAFWKKLRAGNFDLAISLSSSRQASLLAFGSGAQDRAGFEDAHWRYLLTQVVCRKNMLQLEGNLSLVKSLGCRPVAADYCGLLPVSPYYLAEIDKWTTQRGIKSTFIVCAISRRAYAKQNTAIQRILQRLSQNNSLVLVRRFRHDKTDKSNEQIHEFNEKRWTFLSALCARAQNVIAFDNSMAHLAACVKTPVIQIHGVGSKQDRLPAGTQCQSMELDENLPDKVIAALSNLSA